MTAVQLHAPAERLTTFVGDGDTWHHRPLFTEIVHRAHQTRLAGATVLRRLEGYGASHHAHTTRLLSLPEGLPPAVAIVEPVEVIRYIRRDQQGQNR